MTTISSKKVVELHPVIFEENDDQQISFVEDMAAPTGLLITMIGLLSTVILRVLVRDLIMSVVMSTGHYFVNDAGIRGLGLGRRLAFESKQAKS